MALRADVQQDVPSRTVRQRTVKAREIADEHLHVVGLQRFTALRTVFSQQTAIKATIIR